VVGAKKLLPLVTLLVGCPAAEPVEADPLQDTVFARRVDPFIGTADEGNTFPGAVAPWGMVSVSPHTVLSSPLAFLTSDPVAPSGYLPDAPFLHGFGLTHLSGVGCPGLGTPVVAATTGRLGVEPEAYRSAYEDEVASPGHYAVTATDFALRIEATASTRTGRIRVRPQSPDAHLNVLFDTGEKISWGGPGGAVAVVSDREVSGSSEIGGFCAQDGARTVHFFARASRPAVDSGTWKGGAADGQPMRTGDRVGAFLRFDGGDEVEIAVGVSYVSVANAKANLEAEGDGLGFDDVRRDTLADWERALSRIDVDGGTEAEQTIFYTALYHALLHPNMISDHNGEHPVMGSATASVARGYTRYSVFSLWDTFRTVHPLLTLAYPERQRDMLASIEAMSAESGRPPKWELASREVDMMVGDPAAIVVADSWAKGLKVADLPALFTVMNRAASDPSHRAGSAAYIGQGYIPMEEAASVWGPVSTQLEYNYADWALARLAEAIGETAASVTLDARATSYRTSFDSQSGLLRPRNADGSWYEPFEPDAMQGSQFVGRSGGPGYVEGTAWTYAFHVPHDVEGLIALHGGPDLFVERLQSMFDTDRFTMWNEPDIAYPYLFARIDGEAWRTQRAVREIMADDFGVGVDGLPGNDDAGALSAWYVFSAIGLYPDCPGRPRYTLGSPIFSRVVIGDLVIEAPDNGPDRPYVRSARLNGAPLTDFTVPHEALAGGLLELTMAADR